MEAVSCCTVNQSWKFMLNVPATGVDKRAFVLKGMNNEFLGFQIAGAGTRIRHHWSFIGGSRALLQPRALSFALYRKGFCPSASWFLGSQIASNAFTLGTIAVLPFYTLMVLAPNSELTKRSMESNLPYVVLGVAYAYLLYLSWTPDTMRLMFASKYWLPEANIFRWCEAQDRDPPFGFSVPVILPCWDRHPCDYQATDHGSKSQRLMYSQTIVL